MMARGRPHGRFKSDDRVCQKARYARASEYTERIAISAEQQEARIAAVNAECNVEDAPRRRRRRELRKFKVKARAARVSAGGPCCKASGSAEKKAEKGLEHSLGKAAESDLHSLRCQACGATAEFGLRGSKEGGTIKNSCEAHAVPSGCFRIDRDRAAWAADQELRRLRAKLRRLEQELRDLGGAAEDAPSAPASAAGQEAGSTTDWVSVPKSRSLIAMLLLRGGVESNPGPTSQEEKEQALKKSWHDFDSDIDSDLLDHLAKQRLTLKDWRGATSQGDGSEVLTKLEANYTGSWLAGWTAFLKRAAIEKKIQHPGVGPFADAQMREAGPGNQSRAGPSTSGDSRSWAQLRGDQVGRKNYIGSRTEGINNRSYEAYSPRSKTVDAVIDALDELGAVIVRAPPASGKTSLLQLVHQKLLSMGSEVYYIALGQYDAVTCPFDSIWAQHYPYVDFNHLIASPQSSPESQSKPAPPPKPIYILADETQKAFADSEIAFFARLKDVQRGDSKVQLRILLVSCWGSNRFKISSTSYSTPGSWDNANTIGLWLKEDPASGLGIALQFTEEEATEYWEYWLRANGWGSYHTQAEREFLFRATQRQPGALSLLLDRIKELGLQPSRVNQVKWREKVRRWMLSEDLVKAVYDLRSVNILAAAFQEGMPGATAGLSIPVEAVKDLVRKLLKTPELRVHTSELIAYPMEQNAALTLTRLGQLLLENEYFKLPSFLHVRYMARQLCMGRTLGADGIIQGGMFEFIAVVVQRMDPSQLKLAASRNTPEGPPYERLYQNVFFLSAMSYLPHNAILSPDVGYLYGAQGYLDFLLGCPFWWGFELLREGDKRQEHLSRFDVQGKYAQLMTIGVVKEWAVIDFCWKTKPVTVTQSGLVQVSFSQGYETAFIRANGKEKDVQLRGLSV